MTAIGLAGEDGAAGWNGQPQPFPDDAVLADTVLGFGLPEEAEYHLRQAGLSYAQDLVAEFHLAQAEAVAPGHAAVLIGQYRYYFYKGRIEDALDTAHVCIAKALKDNRLVADWREVKASDAAFGDTGSPLPRFFMFTLKGYAYLNMRLGNLEAGREAIHKLLELDPSDKVNARLLLGVLDRIGQPDDDE